MSHTISEYSRLGGRSMMLPAHSSTTSYTSSHQPSGERRCAPKTYAVGSATAVRNTHPLHAARIGSTTAIAARLNILAYITGLQRCELLPVAADFGLNAIHFGLNACHTGTHAV